MQQKQLNLPQLQAKARLRMDIQAAKTVAIQVSFLICYIPATFHSAWGHQRSNVRYDRCPGFLAQFCIFISSGINPVIYSLRTRRFRSALKQLLKDPCGRSPFQEPKEGKKAPPGIPCKITTNAFVSNKITHEPEEPNISHRGCVENINGKFRVRSCKEERSNETKGQSRLHGKGVRLGWVDSQEKLADFTGDPGADDESTPPSGNNAKQEVTVEVHPDHSYCLQESFKKNGSGEEGPQPREVYNKEEELLEEKENQDNNIQNYS